MKRILLVLFHFICICFIANGNISDYLIADSLNKTGDKYYDKELYDMALKNYLSSYTYIQKTDSFAKQADILTNIGIMYDYKGNYAKALDNYLKALNIAEQNNYLKGSAFILNNIGTLNYFWDKYDEALIYYKKSLEIEKQLKNKKGIAQSFINIGIAYKVLKQQDNALEYYLKAIKIGETTEDTALITDVYVNLGSLYEAKEQYKEALNYMFKALDFQILNKDRLGMAHTYNYIGRTYTKTNDYKNAAIYFEKGLQVSNEINYKDQMCYSYESMSDIYSKIGDYKKSFEFYKLYTQLRDSMFNETKHKQFSELQTVYETEKKQFKIEEQALRLRRDRRERNYLLTLLTVLVIFSGIIFNFYFQKRKAYLAIVKQNVLLTEREQELEQNQTLSDDTTKYKTSVLEDEDKRDILNKIKLLMRENKLYLNSNFTIELLAEELDSNRRYISQVINEELNVNFSTFINEYRVKEARKMLLDDKHTNLSLQGIALSVGFNNRTTFNSAFKKFTGVTPSFFMKNHKI